MKYNLCMLKIFRKKMVAKMVLWGILILILPAFVIWGTGSIGRSKEKGPTSVGIINNKKVSFDDFADSLRAVKCQVMLTYFNQPKVLESLFNNKPVMGRLAWDRLIMTSEARRNKIKISDKDIINFITTHPLFSRNGRFDDRMYQYILRNNIGLDPRTFEEIVRQNLSVKVLQDNIAKDVKVTDAQILEDYRRDNEKFKISYTIFPASDFFAKINISETELKDYYEIHKSEFALPLKADETEAGNGVPRIANFEDVKESIKTFLSERRGGELAQKYAEGEYIKIKEMLEKNKDSFEGACSKLNLKTQVSMPFGASDYLEGIGEALPLAAEAAKLKTGEIFAPVVTRKGAIIFRLEEAQGIDEEKFKKEKDEYSKKALDDRKNKFLESWLMGLDANSKLNIDLNNYDKYYQ